METKWSKARAVVPAPGAASVLAALLLACLLAPRRAFGYVDPLSGSLVIQVVAAAVLAAGLTFRRSWIRVSGFFSSLWSRLVGR